MTGPFLVHSQALELVNMGKQKQNVAHSTLFLKRSMQVNGVVSL